MTTPNKIQITEQMLRAEEASIKGFGQKDFDGLCSKLIAKTSGSIEDRAKTLTLLYAQGDKLGMTPELRLVALAAIMHIPEYI